MVETAMDDLVVQLKPLIKSWSPSDQVECVDKIINGWVKNNWSSSELTDCEMALTDSFTKTEECDETIESRLDTLFGAFDETTPSEKIKNSVVGKLDRAGGSMLDST